MTLVDDAKTILLGAWSSRFSFLAALAGAAAATLPYLEPYRDPVVLIVLTPVLTIAASAFGAAAVGSRVIEQPALQAKLAANKAEP